ncbi:glycosyltransferase family A protein [Neptunomonas qingdaonensis]|uniref:Succinoglycan biosynthesis protein ExoW n=1 Tax=Neptunomonas qingdaonensis TaxID=1045558 RepID=A0A1I2MTX3_9GAMM|nr:glycosyltransferase family A protein [Neptunomonas qingdaonensis]SFF94984.1 succinoglycan biosynthesis protein ExoW [Neptunomonas qingdaonensis]
MLYKFACIIPYYQECPNILINAVNSILEQDTSDTYLIVIIDDSSPVSAATELNKLLEKHDNKIEIIHQENQGAAVARNTGINFVLNIAQYIAFLDSDDMWTKDHLRNAGKSFELGADFYFSDIKTLEVSNSRFENNKYSTRPHLKLFDTLYLHQGDLLTDILQYNVVATPTVAYKLEIAKNLRFQNKYRYAGEDHLFWMALSQYSKKTIFSTNVEALCGEGINIFSSSSWGSSRAITRIYHDLLFKKSIPNQFSLTPQQSIIVKEHIKELRMYFAQNIMHKVINKKPLEVSACKKILVLDPILFLILPINLVLYLKNIFLNKFKKNIT